MNSFSLQRPVAQGQQLDWQIGSKDSGRWVVEHGGSEGLMAVVEKAIEIGDLTGFTLFQVKAGWQMAVRPKGEIGWSIKIITEERAHEILSTLEASELPWMPRGSQYIAHAAPLKVDAEANLEAACRELTAALKGWMPA